MNADEWAYRLSALWQPSKSLTMSVNFSWQHYQERQRRGIDLVNCEKLRGRPNYDFRRMARVAHSGNRRQSRRHERLLRYVPERRHLPGRGQLHRQVLPRHRLSALPAHLGYQQLICGSSTLGGYEDMDRESAQDMEQSLNAWDQAMFFLPGTGSNSWSHEIQLQSYGDKKFNWIAGLNFFHEETSTIGYFDNTMGEKSLWNQPDRSTDACRALRAGNLLFHAPVAWDSRIPLQQGKTKEDKGGNTYIMQPS